ncbi:PREDICTED: UPF0184 protein C9orf16 homolog isoform X2 [Trachymyrmex cornetzi]|uniref:UPF0184 protein C9orf16 n=1 Tax=Trachymyrmex cornetzi TaxID=471704 RepID=A0A195DGB0_9HYME|nr:PREDICTED: UPF0184 protein C9orf16 homolog isoform X1 [Trachymyrmex cornetzi]XP_018373917.1 PREDICTED: UPF0184 protein C9orf16 homolog isoform X2 [Trachymyrmex cornetzi]KYN11509.1 UPF0184 protein C9orf16 [Trachymyrmex cornetzi]
MQVEEENMVRDEYPAPEEMKKEEDIEDTMQTEETNHDADEEMNYMENEERSGDICEYLENVVYPEDVYIDPSIKALEDELDHLQTALDHLERKNDDIHAQLTELLQSNREARKQFQESLQVEEQQSK